MKSIGIIGYGKFSIFMEEIFKIHLPDVKIKFYSRSNEIDNDKFFSFEEVCKCDFLIPSVPIKAFEETVKNAVPHLHENTILIDVCSIKVWPKQVLEKYLPQNIKFICTHPMFGPESYKKNNKSIEGFKFVIENSRCDEDTYNKIITFLKDLNLDIVEMSVEDHDKKAATFHFTTMFTALVIKSSGLQRTDIDTASASKMHDFTEMIGDDTEILRDMYKYNPYCQVQLGKLMKGIGEVLGQALE